MQVLSTRVINDRDTGVSRGYGFVNMADVPSAQAAMRSLDNYKVSPLASLGLQAGICLPAAQRSTSLHCPMAARPRSVVHRAAAPAEQPARQAITPAWLHDGVPR